MATRSTGSTQTTPHHELEGQLRESLQRYELIFKATNDVLYELDAQTGLIVWNDALYTQYGYSRDEPADRLEWWAAHVHPDDAMRIERELNEWLTSQNDTWRAEYRFEKADGTYVDVRDRGLVQRNAKGMPLRIIGTHLDITQQKQLDRAKDEFISLVSHQLRTPLTAIRLYSEMLGGGLAGELTDVQKKHVEHISDASVRLIRMVGSILDISRVELGRVVSHPECTDINRLLESVVSELKPVADEKGVTVRFEMDTDVQPVKVDPAIFDQVIHNLLTNSIRYSKSQDAKVDVSFEPDKDGYLLSVKDNGIGIPESARDRVFERFYRAPNTANIKEHGTGLGLYMVKQMAETAGFKIWFETELNKGTTFYVHVPKIEPTD